LAIAGPLMPLMGADAADNNDGLIDFITEQRSR
jgi:hypothetical protein